MTDLNDALEHPLTEARSTAAPPPHRSTKGWVRSFAQARECSAADCSTVLSRYNESGLCWVHGPSNQGPLRRPT